MASDELSAADWRRSLSVRLHLLFCRHCRRYARQIQVIGEAARLVFDNKPPDPGSRDRLRSSILDQIPSGEKSDSDPVA